MEHETVQLLDLPDEILLIIMKKLRSIDILYSLLEVNKRLDKMARTLNHTKSLDFSNISTNRRFPSIDHPIINRFCHDILPQIHQNLEVLIVDQRWMRRILLAGQYPNLHKIGIINYSPYTLYQYLTKELSTARLFQEQITHITIINKKSKSSNILFTAGCARLFSICKKLIFFDANRLSNIECTQFILYNQPPNTYFSSKLQSLFVNVSNFNDCLCLLDGRLNRLSSLTVNISSIDSSSLNTVNINLLFNLREFSLTSYSLTNAYDSRIVVLLRHMRNLKALSLYLNVERDRFIDGIHLNEQVLIHMPKLDSFQFCISTQIPTSNTNQLLSENDIQKTFMDWKYSSVNCYFSNQLTLSYICTTTTKNDSYYGCC